MTLLSSRKISYLSSSRIGMILALLYVYLVTFTMAGLLFIFIFFCSVLHCKLFFLFIDSLTGYNLKYFIQDKNTFEILKDSLYGSFTFKE